jgi:4-hydroxy-tetrahydrodipicolinate synthase
MASVAMQGTFTALVTPFVGDGSAVDWEAYEALVKAQVDAGISGLVPCGTTGESPTLSDAERQELVERAAKIAGGRVLVVAGTGSNSTSKSIEASRAALRAGADAVMIVMPYYNKPTQEGMRRHVGLIASAVQAPIVLYNIPGRSVVELSAETTLRILEECPNVIAVKDATANLNYVQDLLSQSQNRVTVMSGDDPLTLPMMSVGAQGVVSVTSNLYPERVSACVADALAGRWGQARAKHFALLPVHRALFCETNPQPIKAALALKGRMTPALRPPLVAASEGCRQRLARVMTEYEQT